MVLADLTIGDDQFQVETDRVLEAERSLLDLCEKELPAYQVPVFVHAVQVSPLGLTPGPIIFTQFTHHVHYLYTLRLCPLCYVHAEYLARHRRQWQ